MVDGESKRYDFSFVLIERINISSTTRHFQASFFFPRFLTPSRLSRRGFVCRLKLKKKIICPVPIPI